MQEEEGISTQLPEGIARVYVQKTAAGLDEENSAVLLRLRPFLLLPLIIPIQEGIEQTLPMQRREVGFDEGLVIERALDVVSLFPHKEKGESQQSDARQGCVGKKRRSGKGDAWRTKIDTEEGRKSQEDAQHRHEVKAEQPCQRLSTSTWRARRLEKQNPKGSKIRRPRERGGRTRCWSEPGTASRSHTSQDMFKPALASWRINFARWVEMAST